jgi:hypothetical protein
MADQGLKRPPWGLKVEKRIVSLQQVKLAGEGGFT